MHKIFIRFLISSSVDTIKSWGQTIIGEGVVVEVFFYLKKNKFANIFPGVLKRKKKIGGRGSFLSLNFFVKKCSWGSETKKLFFGGGGFGVFGVPHAPTRGSRGVGKRYTSYDHNRTKFWNSPNWRSKVITRKSWRRKNKQEASRPDSSATYILASAWEIHPKIPQKAEIWYLMNASGC